MDRLGLAVAVEGGGRENPVSGALVSDLLSYVMANGKHGQIWVTIQTHSNIVAVAMLGGLAAVVIADGFQPDEDTTGRAEEEGVPILLSPETGYAVAGKLYEMGVR